MSSSAGRIAMLLTALIVVGVVAALLMSLTGNNPTPQTNPDTNAASSAASNSATNSALEIAVENAADPWSKSDGTGCANEIVTAAFKAAQVSVTLKVMPYARAKEMAMSGEIAACVAMSWSPELEGKIRFADTDKPLYVCTATFVESNAKPLNVKSINDLPAGTTIGKVLNYEYPQPISALRDKGIVFDDANSEEINLKKLALGRLDLAIINIDDLKTAGHLFSKAGVVGKVGVVLENFPQATHIGFSVAHPSGEFARAKFNEGFAAIRANGTLEKIRAAWRIK